MRQMLKFFTIGVLGFFITACGQQQSGKNGDDEKQKSQQEQKKQKGAQLAHKQLDVANLGLKLNDGKQWKADSITNVNMLKISNQVNSYGRKIRNIGNSDYQKLEADVNQAINTINSKGQISGEAKKQLDIILKHMEKEAKVLGAGKKQKAQVALFNLSELTKAYEDHFE